MSLTVSYHLIDEKWRRVRLPSVTDKHAMINFQLVLRRKRAKYVIILEPDGSGTMIRPIITKENRRIPQSEMTMIQLSAEDLL